MSFEAVRNTVNITDILPRGFPAEDASRVLRIDDIIFPNDNHELFPGDDISYEYKLCLPINIINSIDNQVVGLVVRIKNTGQPPNKEFRFNINFFDDLYGKQDVGEEDFEELKRLVTGDRVIFQEYGINSSYNHPSSREFITNAQGRASNMSPHQLMSVIGATIGSRTLEDVVGESITSGFMVPGLRAAGYGNDPNLNKAISVTDNSNILGTSLKALRSKVAEELQMQQPTHGSFHSTIVNTLEEHEGDRPERIALGAYQTYNSPVFLSKRKIRISNRKVDPKRPLIMVVKPIIRNFGSSSRLAQTVALNSLDLKDQVEDLMRPLHAPDVRVVSVCRGYAKILLKKTDPTIHNVKVVCYNYNPVTLERTQSEPIALVMDEMTKVVEVNDIKNVYPIQSQITVYVEDNSGHERVICGSKTVNLKTYENSVPLLMPNHAVSRDQITITALSKKNGVLIRLGNMPDGFLYGHLMREDLSIPAQKRPKKHVVGPIGNNRENSAGEFEITDNKVANNRVYRYFLEYKVELPIFPSLVGIASRGQERKNYERRVSFRDATVKFKRSLTDQSIIVGEPNFSSNASATRNGVRFQMGFQGSPEDITFRKIKEILGSDILEVRNDFGRDERAMKTRINIALVERIDRVTGDETFVGASVLQANVVTQFLDTTFFKDKTTAKSLGGKYTYKIKLCRPTVGALQGLMIPLKDPRFNGSPLAAKASEINALKLTTEVFTKTGILSDTETLSNGSYIDIIKSFDTGARFYADFDPPNVQGTVSRIEGRARKQDNGYRLYWNITNAQSNAIKTFLIFVSSKRGVKRLAGAVKCLPGNIRYVYRHETPFEAPRPIGTAPTFHIVPITHAGDLLGQVTVSPPSLLVNSNSPNSIVSGGDLEESVLSNPLMFYESNAGSNNDRGSKSPSGENNVFKEANARIVRKFSDK